MGKEKDLLEFLIFELQNELCKLQYKFDNEKDRSKRSDLLSIINYVEDVLLPEYIEFIKVLDSKLKFINSINYEHRCIYNKYILCIKDYDCNDCYKHPI